MTIDPTDTPIDDSQMFAPVPSWERNKKRGAFGRRVTSEPRSFAAADTTSGETAPAMGTTMSTPVMRSPTVDPVDSLTDVDAASSSFAAAPVYATRTRAKSSNAPLAITAGLILIGGIAAAGWYSSQPHGQPGVAQLTPGAATTTTTTATAATPAPATPSQLAQNTPPPVVAKTTTSTTHSSLSTARAAPARSRAASVTGADASATVRAQPAAPPMVMPTPGVAPPAAAAPAAPLVLNVPPAASSPAASAAPQAVAPQATPAPTEVPQA